MAASDEGTTSPRGAPLLAGAVVQTAHVGARSTVLKVREPGKTTFVVAVAGKGVGLVEARPSKPEGARSFGRLEGFRVAWVTSDEVGLERGEAERAQIDAARGSRVEVKVGPGAWTEVSDRAAEGGERAAWLARGEELTKDSARDELSWRKAAALKALRRGVARLSRRVEAVRGDLERIGAAEGLAQRAQWLVAEAARAQRGARSLAVTDWSTGEAKSIEVALDPSKPARVQIEAMFQRARRLKLGAKVATERLAQAEKALAALSPIEEGLPDAQTIAAVDEAIALARAAAPKDVRLQATSATGSRAHAQAKAPPFRTFHGRGGARILVGRGAAQNDALTFQTARPHDLWLHAKGLPGAHVIVPLTKTQSCPADLLVDASHLAAHFSDARDEAVVDVEYATRRHLRKPRGSAPGFVVVDREKVIAVRIEKGILDALLASESDEG
jgi:predicted ribosome quality control (RQC) complex YloA/Tae2 family protein